MTKAYQKLAIWHVYIYVLPTSFSTASNILFKTLFFLYVVWKILGKRILQFNHIVSDISDQNYYFIHCIYV